MPTAERPGTSPTTRPSVFTIAPHVAFVDALAQGLLDHAAGDTLALARARVFLPNRRAVRSLTDAFVRRSDGGLLLPRMTPIGDLDDGALDTEATGLGLPRPFDPCERRLRLAQLVRRGSIARGDRVTAVEALRLADALASALDALTAEEVPANALEDLELDGLSEHFQVTLDHFKAVRTHWPAVLAATGTIDAVSRNNATLDALAEAWRTAPPAGLIVAAGITVAPPPLARLLGVIARLPQGRVVLPGLDTGMPDDEWDALRIDAGAGDEAHPQFTLKRLLDRMSVGRGEVADWPATTAADGPALRSREVARAMSLAEFTGSWGKGVEAEAFANVRTVAASTPDEEAQVAALALRRVLETEGRTGALVTPDRGLARRVATHLARWGIAIDDSAGQPLKSTPPGTLVLALAEAAVEHFAPVALLAVLKHPLVRRGDERLAWLDGVRALDLDLRGIRPAPGLAGITARVRERDAERGDKRAAQLPWWSDAAALLEPLAGAFSHPACDLATVVGVLRDTAFALAGDELWRGPAGRALADIVAALTEHGEHLEPFEPADAPPLLAAFLRDVPVRPAYNRHPRLAIYGTLEARLQHADFVILGGLNEGVWPGTLAPDPWLPPKLRSTLGLGGPQRSVGLAAHDFAEGLGAPEVLLTRARRDDSAPTVASRLWLRLAALAGPALREDNDLLAWARALDRPAEVVPSARPAPAPLAVLRPRRISVTGAERLRADPFSFYAGQMLRLRALSPLDEDPSAAERGIDLHGVLERWTKTGGDLQAIAADMLDGKWAAHPLMRALWAPRVRRALDWVIGESNEWEGAGWESLQAEAKARLELASGIVVDGRADRVDRDDGGNLAIIDYKTGTVPTHAQVEGGFALQMGLLAWMAGRGAFEGVPGAPVTALRYWKLGGGKDPGKATNPLLHRKDETPVDDHVAATLWQFEQLCTDFLLGTKPFTAKLHPDHAARYSDFDHLARVAEWQARPEQ
ncbi:double-strand break repair protein AddB [Sphingosinicellaceae bacterium]|nr:double-strand break repair protein AddB [Sphingosinicellaceae bacterium]